MSLLKHLSRLLPSQIASAFPSTSTTCRVLFLRCKPNQSTSYSWRRCHGSSQNENEKQQSPNKRPEIRGLRRKKTIDFNWRNAIAVLILGGTACLFMLYVRQQKDAEIERQRRKMIGKSVIGGEWELLNYDGKLQGSKDFLGSWVLIYFGFTHCPDICPDEMEKMLKVADMLSKDKDAQPIEPVFISIDPHRDTPAMVKKYVTDFSPKLRGFTGSPEQVQKVAKTFRVYHSKGPETAKDDYIVDHSVIMYLIDPEGKFLDYYGQDRTAEQIAEVIRLQQMKYAIGKGKSWW